MTRHEVLVLGAGPAGCAAAALLARRSHDVALVRPRMTSAPALAESIPPSARKLLSELELLGSVDDAGFQENDGNTVWWAGREARSEDFPEDAGCGYHVDRAGLEAALVDGAEAIGVRVYPDSTARSAEETGTGWIVGCEDVDGARFELEAGWIIDATGRHGFLARREGREPDRDTTTLALVQRWRAPSGWKTVGGTHTLIESYVDGWAWSVPIDAETRCFTAMVDQRRARLEGADVAAMLDAELAKTTSLSPRRHGATPVGDAWACPASLYSAAHYGRRGLLLAGDAGSFIDPLSSYGVKKALSSGWLAGVVAHTALVEPPMAEEAVGFFDRREREVYRRYRRTSADFFAEAAAAHGDDFWTERARAARVAGGRAQPGQSLDPDATEAAEVPEDRVRAAFDVIRGRERFSATEGPTLSRFERPGVRGQRVVLLPHLGSATHPGGLAFVRGVELHKLVEIAPRFADVPDGWTAYNSVAAPVTLPDYLTALATAFAAGFLIHADD